MSKIGRGFGGRGEGAESGAAPQDGNGWVLMP